jgi:hypothetical protein
MLLQSMTATLIISILAGSIAVSCLGYKCYSRRVEKKKLVRFNEEITRAYWGNPNLEEKLYQEV